MIVIQKTKEKKGPEVSKGKISCKLMPRSFAYEHLTNHGEYVDDSSETMLESLG